MVPYSSMLDVPYELVGHVSWLVYARRRELTSPWRRHGCFKQALLALAHLRKNETLARLAAGFGVSTATTWRYCDETMDVLAAWATGPHVPLTGLAMGRHGPGRRRPRRDHAAGAPSGSR
ncbi:transposase family protein [Streptomyces eurythermus]|uniref:helix-turn-helix domain-containing protein n=1 Tax=Streptomyces eurythermus TaxID=42237 RepID=UPI0036D2D84F